MSTREIYNYVLKVFDLQIVDIPLIIPERIPNRHPTGVLVEILDQLNICGNRAISIRASLLSSSNIATLYQQATKRGIKIHMIQQNDRKIIWKVRDEPRPEMGLFEGVTM